MDMNIIVILGLAMIIFLASAIQSAVGFAFALFATPLLTWTGMPLPDIIATVAVCSFVQSSLGARNLHDSIPWRLSLTAVATRVATLILGLIILKRIANLDVGFIRLIVGLILCFLVLLQLVIKTVPKKNMHWLWAALAFSTSGMLAGICGMGGPPLVL